MSLGPDACVHLQPVPLHVDNDRGRAANALLAIDVRRVSFRPLVHHQPDASTIAAVIVEPLAGSGGVVTSSEQTDSATTHTFHGLRGARHVREVRNFGVAEIRARAPSVPCRDGNVSEGFYIRYVADTIQLAPPFMSSQSEIDDLLSLLGEPLLGISWQGVTSFEGSETWSHPAKTRINPIICGTNGRDRLRPRGRPLIDGNSGGRCLVQRWCEENGQSKGAHEMRTIFMTQHGKVPDAVPACMTAISTRSRPAASWTECLAFSQSSTSFARSTISVSRSRPVVVVNWPQ